MQERKFASGELEKGKRRGGKNEDAMDIEVTLASSEGGLSGFFLSDPRQYNVKIRLKSTCKTSSKACK